MAGDERWYFTKEEINNSPSRKYGVDAEKELSYRQQGATLIQDMGQRLQVSQLVINTAIVYMHRFYMFHPFTKFHRNSIGPAALFLAAKVEEQPRKLEHVIKVAHYILCHHEHTNLDTQSEVYLEKAQELIMNENILLQTLGFDVAIDHPHTYVVKCFQMVRTTTELAQTSYWIATNSLHMTTMCLQYKPAVVACVCIYIVCKWSNYEIQRFTEGKDWFVHVDPTVTLEMLELLTSEFLAVLDKYPSRLKKLMNTGPHGGPSGNSFGEERPRHGSSLSVGMRSQSIIGSTSVRSHDLNKSGATKVIGQVSGPSKTVLSHKEYSEKKEKERRERERAEHRAEKSALPVLLTSSSSSISHIIPSSNTVAANLPHTTHSRPQSSIDGQRTKVHSDNNRQSLSHSSSNRMGAIPAFKEPSIKREVSSVREERLDKLERTSENSVDSAKYLTEKPNSDHKHGHSSSSSSDSSQSKHLEYVKDRKIDVKTETKSDFKTSRQGEGKDHRLDLPSTKVTENKVIPKVKSEKLDSKDDFKVSALGDIKPNNSFSFTNDFILRDFLNPSAIPPDEIFDTDIDTKPHLDLDLAPAETTHYKLKSPPKASIPSNSASGLGGASSASLKGSSSSNSAHTKSFTDTVSGNNDATKSTPKASALPAGHTHTHGHHHSSVEKNLGNGIHLGTPGVSQSTQQTLPPPHGRKKEKNRSPHTQSSHHTFSTKSRHHNVESTSFAPTAKGEDLKHAPNRDSALQGISKDHHQGSQTKSISVPVVPSRLSHEKMASAGAMIPPNTSTVLSSVSSVSKPPLLPSFTSSVVTEPLKPDTHLSIRLPRPPNFDQGVTPSSTSSSGGGPPPAPSLPVVTSIPNLMPAPTIVLPSSKRHKHDHGHRKHKEKKKHKHKEKDKHKEKESKEHREHKEHRKKHKKSKKEEKLQSKAGAEAASASHSLKITLHRTKGIYTPEGGTVAPTRESEVVVVPAKELSSSGGSSMVDTPGRIKLTIPKSRLQANPPSTVIAQASSPPHTGIPPQDRVTPKVRVKKIPKDQMKAEKGERESRKRERSPSENRHMSKIARGSSTGGFHAPQVLDSSRWSSQRH